MLVFTYSHNNNDKETIVKSQVKGYQLSWATWGGGGGRNGFSAIGRFQNSHYQRK